MNIFNTIIILLSIVFIVWIYRRRQLYYLSYKLPGPIALPFLGSLLEIGLFVDKNERTNKFIKMLQVYNRICRIWVGPFMLIEVRKPEYVKIILNNCLEKKYFVETLSNIIDGSLLIAPVPVWKNNRRLINKIFHENRLRQYLDVYKLRFQTFLCELPEISDENTFFNIYPFIHKFVAKCGSDSFFKTNNEKGILKIVENLGRIMYHFFKEQFSIFSPLKIIRYSNPTSKVLEKLIRETHDIMQSIVLEKRKSIKNRLRNNSFNANELCLLEYLLQIDTFSDYEIVGESLFMTLATTDTISSTIAFTILILGIHPEIQDKIIEEIQAIKKPTEELTYVHMNQLVYLERVIKETLRLVPAAPFVSRYITKDLTLDDITIPKGTNVIISQFLLHRDPLYWPDPLKFNPDRFLPEEVAKRHPYTFIPFSAGSRNCIGGPYAMRLIKYFLASFVTKYEITTTFKTIEDIKLRFSVNLQSQYGYPVQLKYRKY